MQIQVKGMDKVISRLDSLGVRAKFAAAKALNETMEAVHAVETKEIADSFVRPVPYIQRAIRKKYARLDDLSAKIYLVGEEGDVDVAAILSPHIRGGGRRVVKASERRLRRFGFMRADQYLVPGPGIQKDQYGNVPGATMVKILSQIQAFSEAGYNANARLVGMSWKRYKEIGSVYVVRNVGVFSRRGKGQQGIPLLFFVNKPQYEAGRFDFYGAGKTAARAALGPALKKHLRVELKRS